MAEWKVRDENGKDEDGVVALATLGVEMARKHREALGLTVDAMEAKDQYNSVTQSLNLNARWLSGLSNSSASRVYSRANQAMFQHLKDAEDLETRARSARELGDAVAARFRTTATAVREALDKAKTVGGAVRRIQRNVNARIVEASTTDWFVLPKDDDLESSASQVHKCRTVAVPPDRPLRSLFLRRLGTSAGRSRMTRVLDGQEVEHFREEAECDAALKAELERRRAKAQEVESRQWADFERMVQEDLGRTQTRFERVGVWRQFLASNELRDNSLLRDQVDARIVCLSGPARRPEVRTSLVKRITVTGDRFEEYRAGMTRAQARAALRGYKLTNLTDAGPEASYSYETTEVATRCALLLMVPEKRGISVKSVVSEDRAPTRRAARALRS